jgi:hypothetical protein
MSRIMPYLFIVILLTSHFVFAEKPSTTKVSAKLILDYKNPDIVARQIDLLLNENLEAAKVPPIPLANDEDFLRRVSFDIAGVPPTPSQITKFALNPSSHKKEAMIDDLLSSDEYAVNWSKYWRDVIHSRATSMRSRAFQGVHEQWLQDQFAKNAPWDQIVTEMLTANGDVRENGATGLLMAHEGETEELAAETSRIFMGIQIQCANCHDHPSDVWKREQFHQLAAFFPRVRVNQDLSDNKRTFNVVSLDVARRNPSEFLNNPDRLFAFADRNRDGKLSKQEVDKTPLGQFFDRVLTVADTDKDSMLTIEEFKAIPEPMNANRNRIEHYMSDLNDPTSEGTKISPEFFVGKIKAPEGLKDIERRELLADYVTSKDNEWFAKAYVNRIWSVLLGAGFYMPIDDLGPSRTASHPEVIEILAQGFKENNYDMKWVLKTITRTQAYQRQIRPEDITGATPAFAAQSPIRLRADQIYNSLIMITGNKPTTQASTGMGYGPMAALRNPQTQFADLFGFDPSTPYSDITGDIPQSLFMMNSEQVEKLVSAEGRAPLARILQENQDNTAALSELYLLVLQRQPTKEEVQLGIKYSRNVNNRSEAFEDLMWSLINSSEFITKR